MKYWSIYHSIPATVCGRRHPGNPATWSERRSRECRGQPGENTFPVPASENIPFCSNNFVFITVYFGILQIRFVKNLLCWLNMIDFVKNHNSWPSQHHHEPGGESLHQILLIHLRGIVRNSQTEDDITCHCRIATGRPLPWSSISTPNAGGELRMS